jgi:S1-C subfamily serine protease
MNIKKFVSLALFGVLFSVGSLFAADKPTVIDGGYRGAAPKAEEIPGYLQDISVTIHASGAQGSGVIKNRDGVSYVLTAGHVVAHLRHTRQVVDPATGSTKTKIEFDDAKIVKELYEGGRSVGRVEMDAEVIRYSDADNGDDLALLRVRKKDFVSSSTHFYCGDTAIPVGTKLLHVGSLLGQLGSNSLTSGIVSQHGRVLNDKVFDQSTCAAFPGSSGGGVYREADGLYIGMLVRGAGETFNLYVPMHRIQAWAKRVNVEWVLDDKIAVPDAKTIKKTPVEELGGRDQDGPGAAADKKPYDVDKEFPFLIKINKKPNFLDLLK